MGLPDVKNKILDGAMGVGGADSTGNFAAVGVAAIPSNGILAFVDPSEVEKTIGDGPLRDLVVSALSIAKTTVKVIALEGTVPGAKTAVTPGTANAGSGAVTVSGNPRNEYDVLVEILADGGLNDAAFRVTFRLYMTFLPVRIRALRSKGQGWQNVGGGRRGNERPRSWRA